MRSMMRQENKISWTFLEGRTVKRREEQDFLVLPAF